jgi:hypothetical protein
MNFRADNHEKRYHEFDMTHSVIVNAPRLTLDELGERLGLSKAEQESIIRMVDEQTSRRTGVAARKHRSASSPSTKAAARKAGSSARKKSDCASASA